MRRIIPFLVSFLCMNVSFSQKGVFVQRCPEFPWLNQTEGPRPKFVWENVEDIIYHELAYPDSLKQTAPEFYALMRCPWVFNRAMRWERQENTIIAASENGDLPLTGEKQVSAWYSDPDNTINQSGEFSVFEKKNAKRQRDCAVLPALQFHVGQHPVVEIEVSEATSDWQFCASIKGRSGPPFITTGWRKGAATVRFDIAEALRREGYTINYGEIHFIIGTWNNDPSTYSRVKFKAAFRAAPAIVACLPVIRTLDNARKNGIPFTARLTNSSSASEIFARSGNQTVKMENKGTYLLANLHFLKPGNYDVEVFSTDHSITPTRQTIRITDGNYFTYNAAKNYFQKNDIVTKPLTGSYQGSFFVRDCGLRSEQIVLSQSDWDQWDRTEFPGERLISWESLTPAELDYRFSFLMKNKWELVHLHSHYGIWERFDAVGALAPHGIEQFALYTRIATKNGLNVMVTLSSYPYGINNTAWDGGTCPYIQYIEAGFKNEDWYNPENEPFRTIYHKYLRDFISLFKDETSVFSLSSSGEGDWKGTWRRFEDTRQVIRSIDTNHIIVSEPIMSFENLPTRQVENFHSDLVGYRNYSLGSRFNTEEEMSICIRLAEILPNSFISEGSFPASNVYTCMALDSANNNCWAGTSYYRVSLRDWIYMGFIGRMPAIVTWDEAFTEDERIILDMVKNQISWDKPFAKPRVSVLINDTLTDWDGRPYLAIYDRVFNKKVIDYRFVENASEVTDKEWLIDPARDKYENEEDLIRAIPPGIISSIPFCLSPGYSACCMTSADGSELTAYIYNTSAHEEISFYLSGNYQRTPEPVHFEISGLNLAAGASCRIFDLNSKSVAYDGITGENTKISLGITNHDYLLFIKK